MGFDRFSVKICQKCSFDKRDLLRIQVLAGGHFGVKPESPTNTYRSFNITNFVCVLNK